MFVDKEPLKITEIDIPLDESDEDVVLGVYYDACAAQQRLSKIFENGGESC